MNKEKKQYREHMKTESKRNYLKYFENLIANQSWDVDAEPINILLQALKLLIAYGKTSHHVPRLKLSHVQHQSSKERLRSIKSRKTLPQVSSNHQK